MQFVSKDIQGPVFSLHTSLNLNSIANIGSFLAKLCQQAKHIVHWLHDWLLPLCCKLIFLTSKFVFRDAGGLGGSRVDNHSVTWTKQMLNSCRLHQKWLKSFQIPWKHAQIINQIRINWKWKPGWLIYNRKKTNWLTEMVYSIDFCKAHEVLEAEIPQVEAWQILVTFFGPTPTMQPTRSLKYGVSVYVMSYELSTMVRGGQADSMSLN